jgi:hypothetical protein
MVIAFVLSVPLRADVIQIDAAQLEAQGCFWTDKLRFRTVPDLQPRLRSRLTVYGEFVLGTPLRCSWNVDIFVNKRLIGLVFGVAPMGGSAIQAGRLSRGRAILLGAVIAVLLGVVGMAAHQETSQRTASLSSTEAMRLCIASYFCGRRVASRSAPSLAGVAEPPALTAEEEVYAYSLWTVHSAAKAWAIDLDFAGILYKTETRDAGKLGAKMQALSAQFAAAESRARAIDVPPSMRAVHEKYLAAIQLYENAAAEMLQTAQDGDDRRLLDAQGMSQHAAEEMLRVGDVLWPGEYKPN